MDAWMIILIVFAFFIVAFVLLAVLWVRGVCKALKLLKGKAEAFFPEMQQFLTKKYEFLTEFLTFLKDFVKDDVLNEAVAQNQICLNEPNANNEYQLGLIIKNLDESLQQNANLQQNEQFLSLMKQRQEIETEAAEKVKTYNGLVWAYNEKVESFPSKFIAQKFDFDAMEYFKEKLDNKTEEKAE